MTPALLFASLLLAGFPAPAGAPLVESAHYRFGGLAPWRTLKAIESPGYRVVLSSPDGRLLEARVEVEGGPLVDGVPFPPPGDSLSDEARAVLAERRSDDPEADLLSAHLLSGSRTELEAVERVIAYTSRRIRYILPGARTETAASCRRLGRGSCVGRSLLAADLLVRAGIPARQVTGVLVATGPEELTPESRAVFDAEMGGVRHRWIEVFVPDLGWVPSDPGGLANTVTARHLALAQPPGADFRVETVSRSAELKRPPLAAGGGGLARPRGSSVRRRVAFDSAGEGAR